MSWGNFSVLLENLFLIFGGMAVFMVGMQIMSQNLEKAAGSKMRTLMGNISNNRFAGVGIGAVVTALMNSSGATTVMLVGFVNVGVISLAQATTIIMGANIGTTISAQIFAFTGESAGLSVTGVMALVSLVGVVLTMVGKKDFIKQLGYILIGVGFIFVGLKFLSGAVSNLTHHAYWGEAIQNMFITLGKSGVETGNFYVWQMLVLFLLGMVITALIHSSAAMTALVISLAGSGLITMPMAIFITLGSNIGTCFTTIVAAFGASNNAKRTAVIHLAFNVIGCILFMIPLVFVNGIVSDWLVAVSNFGIADMEAEVVVQHAIANFHLIFNVLTTALLLPFTSLLVKFANIVIPDNTAEKDKAKTSILQFIDPRFLEAPPIAVTQVRKEISSMANLAFENYKRSLKMLIAGDLAEKELFDETETRINALNKAITSFCIQLSTKELSGSDEKKISAFFRNVSDLERIGDYAQNITEYADRLKLSGGQFSEQALSEIGAVDGKISILFSDMLHCFEYRDLSVLVDLNEAEESVDALTDQMQEAHIQRMSEGHCNAETGAVYLQLAGNMERIADHMVNVAKSVKTYVKKA